MKKNRVQELEAMLISGESAEERLGTLIELAELHAAAFHNREGIRCALEALRIARVRKEADAAGRALTMAMRCHHQLGDFVAAVANGRDAVRSFGEGDRALRSRALQGVAEALAGVESFDQATQFADYAVLDARIARDPAAEAGARYLSGAILAARGRHGAARRLFRQAAAAQRRLGDPVAFKKCAASVANGYLFQANEALRQDGHARARLLWRHAIRVFRVALASGESPTDDAMALAGIVECEVRLEHRDAALAAARQAIELAGQAGNPRALARCHLWESHALRAAGKIDAARRACEYARGAAEQLDHEPILGECLRAESMLNDLCGRFESAQDLEQRAGRVELERGAYIARVREEAETILVQQPKSAAARRGASTA